MANSAAVSFDALEANGSEDSRGGATVQLSAIALDTPARVVSIALESELAAWLRAVGISEGEQVVVLRRAVFGGPLHVRTFAGGEFALNRSLAQAIRLKPLRP